MLSTAEVWVEASQKKIGPGIPSSGYVRSRFPLWGLGLGGPWKI